MKKSLLALVALGAFAGAAHAQSSVTLYGIIDEGFIFNNNAKGGHLYGLASGVMQGSRFGLRGTEDLGSGLKAIFVLENGFDVNSGKLGQGGLMFGRQAYVGLSSQYGTVTLGRQYDSVVDFVGPLEAGDQWGGYIAAHPGDLDNFNNAYRVNNAVKYTSPTYGGFSFGGLYSFGGQAGQFSKNQVWSLGAGYNNGPLVLGVGYLNARTPANFGGMFNTGVGCGDGRVVAGLRRICEQREHVPGHRCGRCVHVRRSDDRRDVLEHEVQGLLGRSVREPDRDVQQRRNQLQVSADPGADRRRGV